MTQSAAQENLHIDNSALAKIGALTKAATAIQQQENSFHLLTPEGFKHQDITEQVEKANPHPNRPRGSATLNDIDSFNKYVSMHGIAGSTVIYADPDTRALVAVLNDHQEVSMPHQSAGWRDFRATYTAALSREFDAWLRNNKQPKEQEEFAVFVEDNIADVMEPSGDVLLQIALTLQAKTEANFNTSRRLDNGQVQITYTENIDARAAAGSIEIPREFTIGCRLFKNGDGYKIRARLKYRLGHGKVKFWYELDRPENAIEDAFKECVKKANETGFPVLIGKP